MNCILLAGLVIVLVAMVAGFRLGWELLHQNGRILLRLEALERQFEELKAASAKEKLESERENEAEAGADATRNADERTDRFGKRSLVNSKIKRDGLKAGTVAPEFCLLRLDGGELSLSELRGRSVLLVFSSPHCGPCNTLAPKLQKFHRKLPQLELVMISQGELEDNRAKVKEQGLTFPVLLQKQWEVSRAYAYFATPVAYLIDESGVIGADVAIGVDGVVDLMSWIECMFRRKANAANAGLLKRFAGWRPRLLSRCWVCGPGEARASDAVGFRSSVRPSTGALGLGDRHGVKKSEFT